MKVKFTEVNNVVTATYSDVDPPKDPDTFDLVDDTVTITVIEGDNGIDIIIKKFPDQTLYLPNKKDGYEFPIEWVIFQLQEPEDQHLEIREAPDNIVCTGI